MSMTTGFDAYDRQIDSDVDFSPETLFHIVTTDDGSLGLHPTSTPFSTGNTATRLVCRMD